MLELFTNLAPTVVLALIVNATDYVAEVVKIGNYKVCGKDALNKHDVVYNEAVQTEI